MREFFILTLLCPIIFSLDNDTYFNETARKYYGMSYHIKCHNYVKAFTCMSACKSIGYQVFRMDMRCKCTCHELKTTTILPFFKWRTNGTIQRVHKTVSVGLFNIVGTLSPQPTIENDDTTKSPNIEYIYVNCTYPTNDVENTTQTFDSSTITTSQGTNSETNSGQDPTTDTSQAGGEPSTSLSDTPSTIAVTTTTDAPAAP